MARKSHIMLLLLALVFSACGGESPSDKDTNSDSSDADLPVLHVSYSAWPGDLIVYLAYEKGFFEAHGLNVELVPVEDFSMTFEKIEAGEVDVWALTLLDAVLQFSKNSDWQVLMLEDFSNGADAIVTLPSTGIQSINDLSGKTVGVDAGTVSEFFLKIVLERQDLSLEDLVLVDLSYDQIGDALESGQIDAGVTYEPYVTDIVSKGGTVILDSSQERGLIVDVFLASSEAIEANPELYTKFIGALLDASDYFNANPEEAAQIMAGAFGSDPEELVTAFKGLSIPDLRDNQAAFDRSSGYASLPVLALQAAQYLYEQNLIPEVINMDLMFSDLIKSIE